MAQKKQDDEPDKIRDRFENDLKTAKKFMDPIHQQMDKFYEQYRNRWSNENFDYQISDLYTVVETIVPILTNNRVRSSVHSDYPDYIKHAQGLGDILDNTYDLNNWDYEQQEIARMAEIYRSAGAYTGYDGDYRNGTGKLCIKSINLRWCYLDPGSTKFEESGFFFYVEPKRRSEVVKLYPKKKQDIIDSVSKRTGSTEIGKVNDWFKTWVNKFKNALSFSQDSTKAQQMSDYQTLQELTEEEKHKNNVAFIHYWYRDEETDKWRVSYWADDVFLEDKENPFWHERLPYDIYNPTKDILSSLGIPIGEHIEALNWEKIMLMKYIMDNSEMHADPPLMYNTAAGFKDPKALKEKATKEGVIPINNPDFVPLNALAEYVQPPTLPNYVVDLPDRLSAIEDRITGVNDSFRGISEATSGKEVQLKQEAAYTRIKTKIDNFELFNKSIAEKVIVNAMQFYEKTRAFRIKGDYTKYQDIVQQQNSGVPDQAANVPFMVKPISKGTNPETGQPNYDRSEFFMYANPREWTDVVDKGETESTEQPQGTPEDTGEDTAPTKQDAERAYKILQMTVEIEAGSSLPTSRLARREEAMELAKAGYLDQEAVLESFDWPKRDDIMKRMQEAVKAQQEAQKQQVQQQADAQAQAETQKMQMQIQMKQMEMQQNAEMKQMDHQHQSNMTQVNNDAKLQQVNAKNEQANPDVAGALDAIRQKVPELANVPDDQLLQLIAGMQQAS